MIVTFSSKAHADIMMFGDIATQLLKLMGHSGTVPGAILAEDVPEALTRLKQAVADGTIPVAVVSKPPKKDGEKEGDDEEKEPPVTLAHRALPLIELLEASAQANCNVMWDQ